MSPRLPDRRQVRRAIPRPLRHLLYDISPGRRRRWRRNPGIERVGDGAVALTFDDGPDSDGTPAVLDALDAIESKATFFVVGEQLADHPEVARAIGDRGHELALHGMTHRRHDRLSLDEAREELGAGVAAFEGVLGGRPRWYRPPYGGSSPALATVCAELELELAYWSSWGYDWEPLPAAEIARVVLRDLEGGTIVLLHDSPRYAEREDVRPTAEALAMIAAAARERGLRLGTLGAAAPGDDG
ncbi:MAG TPA: polysaccharide deacetylase family protein [Solirubrobacterales bacterium]|jgi:peptidoglycan/xylan/chitin deacetylase (PgdA/CDA1 family)